MASEAAQFSKVYRKSLKSYLVRPNEEALLAAYELGRKAVAAHMSLLRVTSIHNEAVAANIAALGDDLRGRALVRKLDAAARFLAETLSPFELLHVRDQEANMALRQMNLMLEEEAKRVAHALHDEAASMLAVVYLELSKSTRDNPGLSEVRYRTITRHLDGVREQLRRLSHEIHPPILEEIGLVPALHFLADGMERRGGPKVAIRSETDRKFSSPVRVAIYRAVQEALTNAAKHGRARNVTVVLRVERDRLECAISDNGRGFATNDTRRKLGNGLGLIAMEERVKAVGGTFQITSSPRKGTTIHLSIPADEE